MAWPCPPGSLGPTNGLACDGGSGPSCAGGTPLKCPEHTRAPGYCIVLEADSVRVCDAVPGCMIISKCVTDPGCAGWNKNYPDSVQLGTGIINTVNADWVSCTKAPPSHALTLVALALLLLCAYVAGGIALASRGGRSSGGRSLLARHPHFSRWVALAGLVTDGIAFSRAGGRSTAARAPLLRESTTTASGGRKAAAKASKSSGSTGKAAKEKKRSKAQTAAAGPSSSASPPRVDTLQATAPATVAASVSSAATGSATATAAATAAGDGGRW